MELQNIEVSDIKKSLTVADTRISGLVITDQKGLEDAADILGRIKQMGKIIKERKEKITKPLNDALKSARELFAPLESRCADAEGIVKQKILAYHQEVNRKAQEEEAKIAKKVEEGKLKFETGAKKIEAIERVENKVEGKTGTVQVRKIKKCEVVDAEKLPRKYLVPDMQLIKEDAIKNGIEIPGVRVYEEETLAGGSLPY